MTTTPSAAGAVDANSSSFRRPELLLVLTLPAFVAYLAVAVATVATKADSSSGELTPAQVSDLGASWMLLHLLWMTPSVLAILGLVGLAERAGERARATLPTLMGVTLVLTALYLVSQVMAYGVDTPTWGDSAWYPTGMTLSLAVGWLGTIPATVLVTLGLAGGGTIPRTARTIAALCGLYLVWEVATYASIAIGSATLLDTVGPPPFLLGVLWAVLGARLWWSDRQHGDLA
jgi:hypothetical protein